VCKRERKQPNCEVHCVDGERMGKMREEERMCFNDESVRERK